MIAFVAAVALIASAAWSVTEALRHTCPHLSMRERWTVVLYLSAAVGGVHMAWRV